MTRSLTHWRPMRSFSATAIAGVSGVASRREQQRWPAPASGSDRTRQLQQLASASDSDGRPPGAGSSCWLSRQRVHQCPHTADNGAGGAAEGGSARTGWWRSLAVGEVWRGAGEDFAGCPNTSTNRAQAWQSTTGSAAGSVTRTSNGRVQRRQTTGSQSSPGYAGTSIITGPPIVGALLALTASAQPGQG